jgi:hypothetical protein
MNTHLDISYVFVNLQMSETPYLIQETFFLEVPHGEFIMVSWNEQLNVIMNHLFIKNIIFRIL